LNKLILNQEVPLAHKEEEKPAENKVYAIICPKRGNYAYTRRWAQLKMKVSLLNFLEKLLKPKYMFTLIGSQISI